MSLSPSFNLLSRPGQWNWLKSHLADSMLELRWATGAHRERVQAKVDAIVSKMAELQALL